MTTVARRTWWNGLRVQTGVRMACVVLAVVFTIAALAPWIVPFDPQLMLDPVGLRSQYPTWAHPFGTDPYSRDLLSRLMAGARVSLTIAIAAVSLSTFIGVAIGLASGYVGGFTDRLLMRIADVSLSVPRVLWLLTIVGLWGTPSIATLTLIIAATGWMRVSRLVRAEVHALRDQEHIIAARAVGARRRRILYRHLLPAVVPLIAVSATFGVGQVLLLESGLSFLGVGLPTPMASWGSVLLDVSDVLGSGRWLVVGPGVVIMITVVAFHHLGDALHTSLAVRRHL